MTIAKYLMGSCLLSLTLIGSGCSSTHELERDIDHTGSVGIYAADYDTTWRSVVDIIQSFKVSFYRDRESKIAASTEPYFTITEEPSKEEIMASGGMTDDTCGHKVLVKITDATTPRQVYTRVSIIDKESAPRFCGDISDHIKYDERILKDLDQLLGPRVVER